MRINEKKQLAEVEELIKQAQYYIDYYTPKFEDDAYYKARWSKRSKALIRDTESEE